MQNPLLARRLGTGDAVVIGLSAMLGAGVFASFGPAAVSAGAGWGVLLALLTAGFVAFCNATSSAQLAAVYPSSGGTYLFGRRVLGPWWGFVAGWGFVLGKTASCAAMAMTFVAYALPGSPLLQKGAAAAVVVALTALNLRGVTRTAAMARATLLVTALVLVGIVALVWGSGAPQAAGRLSAPTGPAGVLQAAGLLFFAFAGYARIATLAEEVRHPQAIGRAILVALGLATLLYLAVGVTLLLTLGPRLAGATTPLADAARLAGLGWADPIVRVGAAAASLGALLALIAGVSRTALAMARERDLPAPLASVSARHQVPDVAEIVVGAAVVTLVLVADLRGAIGFSSFGVLTYYFVANAAAWRQPSGERRWPRALQAAGMLGCLALVVTLPPASVLAGVAVLIVGVAGRRLVRRD